MTPVFRLEYFITAAANGTPCDLEPIFNEEKYLHAIAGASVDLPMPIGRTQEYLAKLAGMDVEIPDHPIFRTEYYLAHMIDSTIECPAPIYREEMFYYEWASNEYVTVTGNPVSFTAKAAPLRQLEVAFSPVQDLHGYDSPWPAGGGKNKWDEEWETGLIGWGGQNAPSDNQIRSKGFIPVVAGETYRVVSSINIQVFYYDANKDFVSYQESSLPSQSTFTIPSGCAYIRFYTYYSSYGGTYKNDIAINYPSSVTTYSPYSNLCPISGWDSLNVEQRGKNLLDPDTFDSYTAYTVNADGSITISAGNSSAWGSDVNKPVFLKAGTYTLSRTETSGRCAVRSSLNNYGSDIVAILPSAYNVTFTLTEDAFIKIKINTGASEYPVTSFFMLELGSSATAYVPYNPSSRSISISLPNTVYGGWVDVVTGEGAECPYYASYNGETLVGPWMSSMDKYEAGTTPTIGAQVVDMGGATTPFSTTPTPINSLVGENNVWSDGDTVEVTVRDAFTDLTFDIFSKLVKKGTASSIIPVGKQIDDTWNLNGTDYEAPWDVVHYDSAGNAYLNWHYAFNDAIGFDAPEAIYYAGDDGLPAGTYYITIGYAYGNGWVKDATIYFTLTSAMDAGDQLFIDCGKDNKNDPAGGRSWKVFAQGGTTAKQSGTTAASGTGTELGSTSSANPHRTNGQINAPSRVVYGYNRWSQSAIRQWLNSDGAAGTWWSPQNGWDRPTTVNQRGFLAGCTADFLAILKPTEVVTVLNSQEGFAETTETTIDRVFLPALEQWDINPELTGEGEPWAYYEDLAEQAGLSGKFQRGQTYEILKKYNVTAKTSAVGVWLRSCLRGGAYTAWVVYYSGNVGSSNAYNGLRGCPACIIKK